THNPRALDHDGKITVLDARKLVLLCDTRLPTVVAQTIAFDMAGMSETSKHVETASAALQTHAAALTNMGRALKETVGQLIIVTRGTIRVQRRTTCNWC